MNKVIIKSAMWKNGGSVGIAERNFHKQFKLGEYMEVSDSDLTNGILTLSLKKELPEIYRCMCQFRRIYLCPYKTHLNGRILWPILQL